MSADEALREDLRQGGHRALDDLLVLVQRRAERLLETGDISKSIYDQRKSQRDALIGQLDEARSNAAIAIKAIDTSRCAYNVAKAAAGTADAA